MTDEKSLVYYFDIDGVLLDLSFSFSKFAQLHYPLATDESDWREIWNQFLVSEDSSSLPALVNVAKFNAFSRKNDICLITGFPEAHAPKRIANLGKHGIEYGKLLFVPTANKADFIFRKSARRQVIYIEDDPAPLLQLGELLPSSKLYQFCLPGGSYQHAAPLIMVNSWEDFWVSANRGHSLAD